MINYFEENLQIIKIDCVFTLIEKLKYIVDKIYIYSYNEIKIYHKINKIQIMFNFLIDQQLLNILFEFIKIRNYKKNKNMKSEKNNSLHQTLLRYTIFDLINLTNYLVVIYLLYLFTFGNTS